MKYYLIAILLVIMGAGARTMFEIAYHGLVKEHGLTPDTETQQLIFLTLWFVSMMIADVLLLNYRKIRYHLLWVILLSVGVITPTLYMFLTH